MRLTLSVKVWIGAAPTGLATNPRKRVASTNKESKATKVPKVLKAAAAENVEESAVVSTEKADSRATKLLKAALVQECNVVSTEKASSKAKKSLKAPDAENIEELTITHRSS
jgi:pantothenate synthetase